MISCWQTCLDLQPLVLLLPSWFQSACSCGNFVPCCSSVSFFDPTCLLKRDSFGFSTVVSLCLLWIFTCWTFALHFPVSAVLCISACVSAVLQWVLYQIHFCLLSFCLDSLISSEPALALYRANRSTVEAFSIALHSSLEKPNIDVRLLFWTSAQA